MQKYLLLGLSLFSGNVMANFEQSIDPKTFMPDVTVPTTKASILKQGTFPNIGPYLLQRTEDLDQAPYLAYSLYIHQIEQSKEQTRFIRNIILLDCSKRQHKSSFYLYDATGKFLQSGQESADQESFHEGSRFDLICQSKPVSAPN